MKKYFIIIFILSGIILLNSCQSVVKVDLPPFKVKQVVNSFADPAELFNVYLTQSHSALDEADFRAINDAKIYLYEDEFLIDTLLFQQDGYYESNNIYPQEGKHYRIHIDADGFDPVDAETLVPSPVHVIDWEWIDTLNLLQYGGYTSQLKLTFEDPSGTENFYGVQVYRVDSSIFNTGTYNLWPSTSQASNSLYDYDYNGNILFNDETFNGNKFTVTLQFDMYDKIDPDSTKLYFEFRTFSRELYLYDKTIISHFNSQNNPFAEPAPVYNNIEGGLGILGGFSTEKKIIQ